MKPNVLLCCTGSVATVKVPEIVSELSSWANVLIVTTKASRHFLLSSSEYNPTAWKQFQSIGGMNLCLHDEHEWTSWERIGDPVLHIELRRWADIVVVAPASADIMAKAANGIADNLLLCVLRAWDMTRPCLICPSMNTLMLKHPSTEEHLTILRSFGWSVLDSVVKNLACGETGQGALASVESIVTYVRSLLKDRDDLFSEDRIAEKASAHKSVAAIIAVREGEIGTPTPSPSPPVICNQATFLGGIITGFALCGVLLLALQRSSREVALQIYT